MRLVLVLGLLLVLALGCSVPGMDEVNSKVDDLSDRVDEVAEDAGRRAESAYEDLEDRIMELEMQLAGYAESPAEASASIQPPPGRSPVRH
jgi:cell division septum initiation protein DivIVA